MSELESHHGGDSKMSHPFNESIPKNIEFKDYQKEVKLYDSHAIDEMSEDDLNALMDKIRERKKILREQIQENK